METFQYTITDEIGIHARPAGELAKLAKEFQSKITIKTETKQADAEKLMAVMALGSGTDRRSQWRSAVRTKKRRQRQCGSFLRQNCEADI